MLSFASDYIKGAHPLILQRLIETNMEALPGYGSDIYCDRAKEKIRSCIACPKADIYFISGGTQTNQLVIDTMLKAYEGVIAATTGHVSVHEAGAIEYTGHKVLEIESHEGKIDADELDEYIAAFFNDENHEHMVFPGMVYISFPTEYGTIYKKSELENIYSVCKKHKLPLFIDGARLGYGLSSKESDLTMSDIARLCDVFYIGGTKVGALLGEAVVFPKNDAPLHFMTMVKQHGALLAKGRVLGIQFDALFTDDLYFKISAHAIDMTNELIAAFEEKGYRFFIKSPTNQQFIILDNNKLNELKEQVDFSFWEKYDENNTVVRFAASWSTTAEEIERLKAML